MLNPGLVMLGSVNARSIRNRGPASHVFDFLCLTETHIRTTDSDSFLCYLTPDGFSLIHRPCSTGIGVWCWFLHSLIIQIYQGGYSNYRNYNSQVGTVAAPAEWSKLPQTVRSQQTIHGFRSQLKTHLFRLAYPHFSYTLAGAF